MTGIITWGAEGWPLLANIKASLDAVAHRGPDHRQVHTGPGFAAGHARLSILDLSPEADQPFFSGDGRDFILHNGEIFNYRELGKQLSAGGQRLRTASDTEVVLSLVSRQGPSALARLDGFFATVVRLGREDRWYLARDPAGVKPLYYYHHPHYLAFSSEMKGLLALRIPALPDWDSLLAYFQLNYIPQPWTALQGVRQVEPGCFLQVDAAGGQVTEHPYREPRYQPVGTEPTLHGIRKDTEVFADLLEKAVEKRLIADVPAGALLSGGLDSTAVVTAAAQMKPGLKTYCLGFSDRPVYDESRFAELAARHAGTDHRTISVKSDDLLEAVPALLDSLGEPYGDSSAIAMYLLSREVSREVKLVLGGDGGDELLGGYNKHRAERFVRENHNLAALLRGLGPVFSLFPAGRHTRAGNLARQLQRLSEGVGQNPAARYWSWASFTSEKEAMQAFRKADHLREYAERKRRLLEQIIRRPGEFNEVLFTDFRLVLQSDMLVKADRMSMAHGLEIRSPFLDHALVSFCSALPAGRKIVRGKGKAILREALEGRIPDEILYRRKHGFEVPLHRWLNHELKTVLVEPLLNRDYLVSQGIFDPVAIGGLLKKMFSGSPGDAAIRVWGLLVFQHWWRNYMEGKG